jgi:putative colanic acid biosysnthesis UDP-glucose lipid carrier transferase
MRKPLSSYLRLIFIIGDLFILNLAIAVALLIFSTNGGAFAKDFTALAFPTTFWWLILSFFLSPYKFSRVARFAKIVRVHFSFILIHFLAVISTLFILDLQRISILALSTTFTTSLLLLFVWRVFYFYINKTFINKNFNFKNVIIIGYGDIALEMRKFFRLHPEHGYRFLGYFHPEAGSRDVRSLAELDEFCRTNGVHEIYCCLPHLDNTRVKQMVDYGLNNLIKVKLITDYRGFFQRGITIERYDNIPVFNVAAIPLDDRRNQAMKRAFDLLFSGMVTILVLSWLIPLIALAIKLDSRGPIFFKQKRSGKGNKPFNCLKFRTMIVHGQEFVQATRNDSRITRVGKFLRKTSLDEFPQFINVLKGQMSIIGPRPHPIKLNEQFSSRIEKFMARQYVKPGITGLAQAKGFRGETNTEFDMRSRVKLDRFYIENWSFVLDLKIIIATVISLLRGTPQAY